MGATVAREDSLEETALPEERAAAGWRRALLVSAGIVITMRVLLSVWAAVVLANFPTTDLQKQYAHVGMPMQQGGLAAPWEREDALWYEKIATYGYRPDDGSTAFLPLLPVALKVASLITLGNVAYAGLLVAMIAATLALALLFRLASLDGGESTGLRATLYLALFPTAFFLLSTFTESLFLVFVVGAFWFARQGRWWIVAGLAALAGLTKVQGALLCVPLAVEFLAWAGWRWPRVRANLLPFVAVVAAGPLATAAFFAYVRYVVGDTIPWNTHVNALWNFRSTWPGDAIASAVQKTLTEGQFTINTFDLLMLVLFGVLSIAALRLRLSYGLQALTVLGPVLLRVNANFPLMSLSRYVLVAFPCFIVLALWTRNKPRIVHQLILVVWVSLLLVWSMQSIRGFWVG